MTNPSASADGAQPTPPTEAPSAPVVDLAGALGQMAGLVLSRETVQTALELVTALAAAATPGTLGAGVSIMDEHGKRSRAASNKATEEADALQYELDEGPCLTAWRTREVTRIDDTATDSRWPRWSEAAGRRGVRSVLSAPLVVGDGAIGAMKVYCERPMNYGPRDEHIMRLLAAQAAILLANSQSLQEARRLSRQLTDALASRDIVWQATGVLMARGAVDHREAFGTLAATASQADRPVADVARDLLAALAERRHDSTDG